MTPTDAQHLQIRDGHILVYRIYDIADEIDLNRCLSLPVAGSRSRLRFRRLRSPYIIIPNPPVVVSMGREKLTIGGFELEGEVMARVYDYGAVSIIVRLAIAEGSTWLDMQRLGAAVSDSDEIDQFCWRYQSSLATVLQPAVRGVRPPAQVEEYIEDYLIFYVRELDRHLTAQELADQIEIARLLEGEPQEVTFSAQEREFVLRHAFSYSPDDLVVVEWASALVYDPTGSQDVPDILEFACTQLLELRFYDDLLDRELDRIYEDVQRRARIPLTLHLANRYAPVAQRALLLLMEITDITEKVDNSLKVVADQYLARIYRAAAERMGVRRWRGAVDSKLELLNRVATLLNNQVDTYRSHFLELLIVILIVLEIILALVEAV